MNRDEFRRLLLSMELAFHSLNPLSLLMVALWLVSGLVFLYVVPVGQRQLLALHSQTLQTDTMQFRQVPAARDDSQSQAQRNLAAFKAKLGDARYVEQQLRTLFIVASDLQLNLPQGQYKLTCEHNFGLCSYRIQLPLKGSYLQIRKFAEQALQAIPFASIDELAFKRESVSDGDIEARLAMTLYVRPRPGGPAVSMDPGS